MSFLNTDILISNIKLLMEKNDITQAKLAEHLSMSQPNISKALNPNDKKTFTLDQVVGIADYFKVSVDDLIQNISSIKADISQRSIGKMLIALIENEHIKFENIKIKETVFHPFSDYDEDGCYYQAYAPEDGINEYKTFYFPSFWQIPNDISPDEHDELQGEIYACGNETAMKEINLFINNYLDIYKAYKNKQISEQVYQIVVNEYLSKLNDKFPKAK